MDSSASPVTFNSLNDDVRHHILRYFGKKSYMIFGSINKSCKNLFEVKDIPKKTYIYAHGTFEQIMQVYNESQEYKTDKFLEFIASSEYHDGVNYGCKRLAKSIVLHNRKDVFAWALKKKDQFVLEAIYREASKVGRLDIIQEVFPNTDEEERKKYIIGYRRNDDDSILTNNAARGGHFETLKWLLLNDFWYDKEHICGYAASSGNIEMVNWLLAIPRFCSLNESACSWAASKGQLEMLKILKEKGCPWDDRICSYACENGHLDVLKWSHENGCKINEQCSDYAARSGHLECLKYLHENNCPWDSDITLVASSEGHLHILKYLYSNGCEWNTKIPLVAARPFLPGGHGHMHILEWVHDKGFGFDKEFTLKLVRYHNLHALQWLHHCGYEMYEELPSVCWR